MEKDLHIVIADANEFFPHFHMLLTKVCQRQGYSVSHCQDIDKVADELSCLKPVLVVVDHEWITPLTDLLTETPWVAIGDINDQSTRQELMGLGCHGLLVRNFGSAEIGFVLRTILFEEGASRRQFPRVITDLPGRVELADKVIEGRMVNISQGGAFLQSYEILAQGNEALFSFELPIKGGAIEMRLRVRIVYAKPYHMEKEHLDPGMGICFIDLDTEEQQHLCSYVDEHLIR